MYNMIENRMKSLDVTIQVLAERLHVNTSTISRFLSGKTELKFETLFEMIQILFHQSEQPEVCKFYFMRLRNKRNIKCVLEYFSSNQNMPELKEIMDREREHATHELKELINVYELIYKMIFTKKELSAIVEDRNVSNPTFKSKEARAVLSVQKMLYGLLAKKYSFTYEGKDSALSHINELEDGFIKNSLLNCVDIMLIATYIYRNDIKSAQECINRIQSNFTNYYTLMGTYYFMGKIHFSDNYQVSKDNFNKALELSKTFTGNRYYAFISNKCLPFLHLYHAYHENIEDVNKLSPHLQAYYYFRCGDVEKAKELITHNFVMNCPYNSFIKAEIFNDIHSYWMSLVNFVSQGDIHHVKLPIIELSKRGVPPGPLHHLINNREVQVHFGAVSSFF
ncbi:AimR family lysis-lysogeny pheromone receptor [Priestia filamentosa]|uniref:AimR family lysis-lysogeny pheromone receptor n=1 Tax=Priestia filamentosa TaxID=1402861 RepID=UPI0005896B0D